MNQNRNEQKLLTSSFPSDRLKKWHQQYQEIIRKGLAINPLIIPMSDALKKRGRKKQTKVQNLLDLLENNEKWMLAFFHDFQIPFTNNLAEQDIRMIKVNQKISDSFRTFEGAELFATIRSYISTVHKQYRPIFQDLKSTISKNYFIPAMTGLK